MNRKTIVFGVDGLMMPPVKKSLPKPRLQGYHVTLSLIVSAHGHVTLSLGEERDRLAQPLLICLVLNALPLTVL